MTHNEAPLSVNFKPHGGHDAPLVTVRASNPDEMVQYLNAMADGELFDAVGRANAALTAKYELGKGVGAVTEQAAPQQQAPADHMAPTSPQPEWSVPQQQQAPPVAPPQAASQWGQPQQAAPAGYAAAGPATPPPPAQPTPGSVPGAPMTPFGPAKLVQSKPGAPKPWQAWADPRPAAATQHIGDEGKTSDPQHPGLAAGTHKLWAWVR
jgi:hypothetical protein